MGREGINIAHCGNLYIADETNNRIRKVTFTSTPVITLSGGTSATIGTSVTISASLIGTGTNYSIKWYNKGILFSTTTIPSVTYTKTMCTDSITAHVYGCSDSATSVVKVIGCNVGVVGLQSAGSAPLVYPNPVRSELTIEAVEAVESVIVTNVLGQVVIKSEKPNGERSVIIDVGYLPAGVYVLKINGLYAERLIKE